MSALHAAVREELSRLMGRNHEGRWLDQLTDTLIAQNAVTLSGGELKVRPGCQGIVRAHVAASDGPFAC